MPRPSRVLTVTAGLAAAGAAFGALASSLAVAIWFAASPHLDGVPSGMLGAAALVGGALGAVLGPAGAWLLLRRVPLGRAVLGTTTGALAGGVVAPLLHVHPVGGAVAGFVGAALLLRARAGPRAAIAAPNERPPRTSDGGGGHGR